MAVGLSLILGAGMYWWHECRGGSIAQAECAEAQTTVFLGAAFVDRPRYLHESAIRPIHIRLLRAVSLKGFALQDVVRVLRALGSEHKKAVEG